MAKLSLAEAQKIMGEFSLGFGGVCNDVFDAIEDNPAGPALQSLIERGRHKVKQFEDTVAKLSETHARQFKADYERKLTKLKVNIGKLEDKQKINKA